MLLSIKKFPVSCRVLFVLCLAVLAVSCSDDDSDPAVVKSSAKAITSFKFATPAATGTITESDKKIAVSVPAGTNVTELVPTIVVSEKATVSPNTGVKQNFTNAVTYTVTAEDGTKQAYVVTVTVATGEETDVTVTKISAAEVQAGKQFYIEGTNFATYSKCQISLDNIAGEGSLTVAAEQGSTSSRLNFTIPETADAATYSMTLTSDGTVVETNFTISVTAPKPKIYSLSVLKVERGDQVTITGVGFSEAGNAVSLYNESGFGPSVDIVEESTRSITFIADAETGHRYTVVVTNAKEEEAEASEKLTIGTPPEVTAINKTTFARGEQIVLTGQGLKVDGISPFLYFMPDAMENDFRQGIGKVNDAGTEITYTIPTGWAADSYELTIDYDGNTINKFRIVVQ